MKESSYIFTSQRLGFRNWKESDISNMAAISADPKVMEFFPSTQDHAHTARFVQEMMEHYDRYGYCYFAVEELESKSFIGFIGLKWVEYEFGSFTDIGWRLSPAFWGKGYATEGAICCLEYGFKVLSLEKIFAIAPRINIPSIHVMQKAGMSMEREFEHPMLANNESLKTCVLYQKCCAEA